MTPAAKTKVPMPAVAAAPHATGRSKDAEPGVRVLELDVSRLAVPPRRTLSGADAANHPLTGTFMLRVS